MSWREYFFDCEFCGEEFEAQRYDARFCSPKCRTAHHRREKRRENAKQQMMSQWSRYTVNQFAKLVEESPDAADGIKDTFIAGGAEAAAKATAVAYCVMMDFSAALERERQQRRETAEALRECQAAAAAAVKLLP